MRANDNHQLCHGKTLSRNYLAHPVYWIIFARVLPDLQVRFPPHVYSDRPRPGTLPLRLLSRAWGSSVRSGVPTILEPLQSEVPLVSLFPFIYEHRNMLPGGSGTPRLLTSCSDPRPPPDLAASRIFSSRRCVKRFRPTGPCIEYPTANRL